MGWGSVGTRREPVRSELALTNLTSDVTFHPAAPYWRSAAQIQTTGVRVKFMQKYKLSAGTTSLLV